MTRVLSGVVLGAAALAAVLLLPPVALRVLVSAIAALAAFEYLGLVGGSRISLGVLFAVAYIAWTTSAAPVAGLAAAGVLIAGLAAASIFFPRLSSREAILAAFSVVYIGVPLGLLANVHLAVGWRATMLLIATVAVSDSSQFYSGRAFGRRKLAPAISPKKTIEGAIGGFIAGVAFMAAAGPMVFPQSSRAVLAALGFFVVLLGIVGDLFESRLKREANVKDSSALIPGHGGALDRIDALLFATLPFALYVDRVS
jgi:phosphatidate cytidylyltransferase